MTSHHLRDRWAGEGARHQVEAPGALLGASADITSRSPLEHLFHGAGSPHLEQINTLLDEYLRDCGGVCLSLKRERNLALNHLDRLKAQPPVEDLLRLLWVGYVQDV